jgi:hypothetical protein
VRETVGDSLRARDGVREKDSEICVHMYFKMNFAEHFYTQERIIYYQRGPASSTNNPTRSDTYSYGNN